MSVDKVKDLAAGRGATAGQIALAWVTAQGAVPIPGTKRRTYLEENAAADTIDLAPAELRALNQAVPADAVTGARDRPAGLAATNR